LKDDDDLYCFQAVIQVMPVVTTSKPALRPIEPPIQWIPGALSSVVERPGRETDYSFPSSTGLRMRGAIPPLLQYVMVWCLIKHRGQFYLTYSLYRSSNMHLHRHKDVWGI